MSKFTDSLIGENLEIATEYFKSVMASSNSGKKGKTSGGSIGFIPFNINFTMDGLSGIKIYNELVFDTNFLPVGYSTTLDFIVTGVDHKLKDGDWETDVKVTLIPKTDGIDEVITGSLSISAQQETYTPPPPPPGTGGVSPTLIPLVGGGNVEKALRFFIDIKGYPKWKAAGIVAAIMGESGGALNPAAVNPSSGAYGIAQWLGTRKTKLSAVSPGRESTLEGQLDYLYAELQPGTGYTDSIADGYIAQATNEKEMLAAMATFERWGYPGGLYSSNGNDYQKVYEIMKKEAINGYSPDGGGGGFNARIGYLQQVKDLIIDLYGSF